MKFLRLINWNTVLEPWEYYTETAYLRIKPPWGKQSPVVKSPRCGFISDWSLFLHFSWVPGQATVF